MPKARRSSLPCFGRLLCSARPPSAGALGRTAGGGLPLLSSAPSPSRRRFRGSAVPLLALWFSWLRLGAGAALPVSRFAGHGTRGPRPGRRPLPLPRLCSAFPCRVQSVGFASCFHAAALHPRPRSQANTTRVKTVSAADSGRAGSSFGSPPQPPPTPPASPPLLT